MIDYEQQLQQIIDASIHTYSNKKPSVWAEERMRITTGKFQGRLSLDRTPYSREILDALSPYSGVPEITLMAGAQWGKTKTIVEPIIAYYISENPLEMGYLTGHSDLSEESIVKLDSAIDNAGLRHLIRANSMRVRNSRSGDTNKSKEFPMGSLVSGSATNHKILRQRTWGLIIADDIEAAKLGSKESGSTIEMIRARANSYGDDRKILWVSTPETKGASIIETLFESGDKRYYHIPCPCCGTAIKLEWSVSIEGTDDKAGIFWKVDNQGNLIRGSVGYICQSCAGFFTDKNKWEFNLAGMWIPSQSPRDIQMRSYHLSTLYATPGMNSWELLVSRWLAAHPDGQPNDGDLKVFYNLVLGQSYAASGAAPKADKLQENVRNYKIGVVPERMSLRDGNGRIIMITCGADLNGTVEDARLDYQFVAWAESGACYNIGHGSIGTFVPAVIRKDSDVYADREVWTYEENCKNSVWPEFERILKTQFDVDADKPRKQPVMIAAVDTGNTYKNLVYNFIEKMNNTDPFFVQGVKGRADEQYFIESRDMPIFRQGKERDHLWILETGVLKDRAATNMQLNWNGTDPQPTGFMNFPRSEGGLYEWLNFYSHFQSEHRVIGENKTKTGAQVKWEKVASNSQNHQWDCYLYNMAIRDVHIELISKRYGLKDYSWANFCKEVCDYYASVGI